MNIQIERITVMKRANILYHHKQEQRVYCIAYDPLRDRSNCLKRAWWFAHFLKALRSGIVTFSFFKKDGSIRHAKGTLYHLFIPNDKLPKGLKTQSNYRIISYFDLDKQDWRSFDICEFIGFVNYYRITPSNFLPDKEAKRKKVDKKEK